MLHAHTAFATNFNFDHPLTNSYGIDKTLLMIKFIPVIDSTVAKASKNLDRLKSFLCQKLQRGMTPQEDVNLMQGIVNYLKTEPASNERNEAMEYLFECKFLNP